LRDFGESPPSKGAVGHGTVITGEPGLADGATRNFTGIKGFKVSGTPDALVKLWLKQQWVKVGHASFGGRGAWDLENLRLVK
jgi:hypothetical protein